MAAGRLALCFGTHNHQPVGNFEHVMAEAAARAYRPFLERLRDRPEVRVTMHWTGSLLEWLREREPATFDGLGGLVDRGQVELLTGGFYEPILAVLPDHDKRGQIERLTAFIQAHFGVRPRGMWLAERVWEPHLPGILRQAGVEYVLVDDSHFGLAGADPEGLAGYYLTEDQGAVLAVFPISQPLRYLIPFADVEESVRHLEARRGRAVALTAVDDGEKFGVWPGTHGHVYAGGWLDRFYDRLLALSWLELTTFADVVDRTPPAGRIYLPTASYREMGEWALPAAAGDRLAAARRCLAPLAGGESLLRGGFWRNFLVKYPEVADTYWKMLRLSRAIERAAADRPGDGRLAAARLALWRGQANDAYWHGVFGGCYLPHLRRAVKQALLEAEWALAAATGASVPGWSRGDGNGDGREELFIRTADLAVTVAVGEGAAITELGVAAAGCDLADVLARRPEAYHAALAGAEADREGTGAARTIHGPPAAREPELGAALAYDEFRRASLLDGLFEGDRPLDPVAPWPAARLALGRARFRVEVEAAGDEVRARLRPVEEPLVRLDKRLAVRHATVEARYRLEPGPAAGPGWRWAVQWNLALSAGDGPQRYLRLPGRPALRSRGRERGLDGVTLVDEWLGLEAELGWTPAAELAWGPVETVSVSEAGFERIYQGTAFLLTWPLDGVSSTAWELATSLTVRRR